MGFVAVRDGAPHSPPLSRFDTHPQLDSVLLRTNWWPVRVGARSRQFAEKIRNCEQSAQHFF